MMDAGLCQIHCAEQFHDFSQNHKIFQKLGHMKNTRRNTCTGARYAMPVRVNY